MGEKRGIGGENKNEGGEVKGHLFLMKYKALWLAIFLYMREDGLQAHLQGFSTTDTYNIITVHSSSTSDERTFIILCTVNIVAHAVHPQTHYC